MIQFDGWYKARDTKYKWIDWFWFITPAQVEKDKDRSIHIFIASISLFDMLRIIGTMVDPAGFPYSDSTDECRASSVLTVLGALSSFLLVGLIAVIMVISVFKQDKAEEIVNHIHKLRALILLLITFFSLLAALIPIHYWCDLEYHAYLRGVYFIPLLAIFGLIVTSYGLIFGYFCHQNSMEVMYWKFLFFHSFWGWFLW